MRPDDKHSVEDDKQTGKSGDQINKDDYESGNK